MKIKRHNLVEVSEAGRLWAYQQVKESGRYSHEALTTVRGILVEGFENRQIPGVMRREEGRTIDGAIPVGFASPFLPEGQRLRVAAFVPQQEIRAIITPYEVLNWANSRRNGCLQALEECKEAAQELGVSLGVWGSAGLELFTGLTYTHNRSDLDLLMTVSSYPSIERFYSRLVGVGNRFGCRIDLELDLPNGYGVKAAELFMQTKDVLGKGISDVGLFPKEEITAMLGGEEDGS